MQFDKVIKRDGTEFPFNVHKIEEAIEKAFLADDSQLEHNSTELSEAVLLFLSKKLKRTPHIEDIQDMVELVLSNTGYASVAKKYILYRENRRLRREFLEVRDDQHQYYDETDVSLIVENTRSQASSAWDARIIVDQLLKTEKVTEEVAKEIASQAEKKILSLNLSKISTRFINEITSNLLFEMGYEWIDFNSVSSGLPLSDIDKLFFNRNAHSFNNPDKIRTSISSHVLKQYSLSSVFSKSISDAHKSGQIHISGVGHPGLFSSGLFSIEKIKTNGLHLEVLPSYSKPAQHIGVLSSHINTFLSCMRSYFYGPVALSYLNIYLAPFLDGLSDKEIAQEAQNLIYITSQNAFSQGGMALPIDFNVYSYIPSFLKNKKAIGPGGIELDKTYKEYEPNALRLMSAMLDCLDKGDGAGKEFIYPIVNVHFVDQCFKYSEQNKIMSLAAQVTSRRQKVHFIKDGLDYSQHSSQVQLMFKHPVGSRREMALEQGPIVLQSISINLPQLLLRTKKLSAFTIKKDLSEMLNHLLGLAYQAHKEKLRFMKKLAVSENSILVDVLSLQADSSQIVELEKAKTLISIVGLNEFIYLAIGEHCDSSAGGFVLAQEVLQIFKESLLFVGFSELDFDVNPDLIASQRFARIDKDVFAESEKIISITSDVGPSYTNSYFIRDQANLELGIKYEKESLLGNVMNAPSKVLEFPDGGFTALEIIQFIKNQS